MATGTSTHETTIEVLDDLPVVRITRAFDAPPSKVFRAHADPQLLARWNGPHELETHIDHHDCRTGGSWRHRSVQGDDEYAFFGSFHEVRPDELIVQTFTYEGAPDSVSLERLVLTDLGDGRTQLHVTSMFDSFEARDAMIASGMETGMREGYEQLDELLASGS